MQWKNDKMRDTIKEMASGVQVVIALMEKG